MICSRMLTCAYLSPVVRACRTLSGSPDLMDVRVELAMSTVHGEGIVPRISARTRSFLIKPETRDHFHRVSQVVNFHKLP